MDKIIERLKEELDMMSEENLMITVKRTDLVRLIKAYDDLKKHENLNK